jgi:hypothetical protein
MTFGLNIMDSPGDADAQVVTRPVRGTREDRPCQIAITELDEAECLKLISPGGIGRIAYSSRSGPAVLPVNY